MLFAQVWNEQADGKGAANFITGAGGFLQNILAGYAGFTFGEDVLYFDPVLPDGCTRMYVVDVDFMEAGLGFEFSVDELVITQHRRSYRSPDLFVVFNGRGTERRVDLRHVHRIVHTPTAGRVIAVPRPLATAPRARPVRAVVGH